MDKKRIFDLTFATFGLAVFAIPMAISYAAVTITTGHPALFKQKRIGKNGEPFTIYKFRSMREASNKKTLDIDRVTKVGKFLRKYGLDETPQIFNILKGNMSIVGPRPLIIHGQIIPTTPSKFKDTLKVNPGLTGPYQVESISNKNLTNPEILQMEWDYATARPSITKDFMLIVRTIPVLFCGKNDNSLMKNNLN